MTFFRSLFAACSMASVLVSAAAEPTLTISSIRHSDPLALRRVESDQYELLSARHGKNLVFLQEEARLSAPWRWGQVSLLGRRSITLVASPGAVRVVQDLNAPGRPAGDNDEAVSIRYTGFSGVGVELARWWGVPAGAPGLRFGVAGQALQLLRLRRRVVDGEVAFDSSTQSYTFTAESRSINQSAHFPFQQRTPNHGYGLLANLESEWCQPGWCVAADVQDLGRLHWRSIPVEDLSLSSRTVTADSNGLVAYKPLFEGRNTQPRVNLHPPIRVDIRSGLNFATSWRLLAAWQHVEGFGGLPRAGLRWSTEGHSVTALWHFHERRLAFNWSGENWTLGFGADRLGGNAHSRELTAGWRMPW